MPIEYFVYSQCEAMNKPEDRPNDPYEAVSYDLNKFRERRLADRRFTPRDTPDRRMNPASQPGEQEDGGEGGSRRQTY